MTPEMDPMLLRFLDRLEHKIDEMQKAMTAGAIRAAGHERDVAAKLDAHLTKTSALEDKVADLTTRVQKVEEVATQRAGAWILANAARGWTVAMLGAAGTAAGIIANLRQ